MVQLLWKTDWQFLTKLNRYLPYDPVSPQLAIYLREKKLSVPAKTCTQVFLPALFAKAPNWKQPNAQNGVNFGISIQWTITSQQKEMNDATTKKRNDTSNNINESQNNYAQ